MIQLWLQRIVFNSLIVFFIIAHFTLCTLLWVFVQDAEECRKIHEYYTPFGRGFWK